MCQQTPDKSKGTGGMGMGWGTAGIRNSRCKVPMAGMDLRLGNSKKGSAAVASREGWVREVWSGRLSPAQ